MNYQMIFINFAKIYNRVVSIKNQYCLQLYFITMWKERKRTKNKCKYNFIIMLNI